MPPRRRRRHPSALPDAADAGAEGKKPRRLSWTASAIRQRFAYCCVLKAALNSSARQAPVTIGISGREVLRNRRVRLRFLLRDAAALIRVQRIEDRPGLRRSRRRRRRRLRRRGRFGLTQRRSREQSCGRECYKTFHDGNLLDSMERRNDGL